MEDYAAGLDEQSRKELFNFLQDQPGPKLLLIHQELSSLVSALVTSTELRNADVVHFEVFGKSSKSVFDAAVDFFNNSSEPVTLMLLTRPTPDALSTIAKEIKDFLPRLKAARQTAPLIGITQEIDGFTQAYFEELGIAGDIQTVNCNLQFASISGIGSLVLPLSDLQPSKSHVSQWLSARALYNLQNWVGFAGKVTCFGSKAQSIASSISGLRTRHRSRTNAFEYQFGSAFDGSAVSQLIIVDRQADPVTPLLTQLTYGGLVDESYGISSAGTVCLDKTLSDSQRPVGASSSNRVKFDDAVFYEICHKNFAQVGSTLNTTARELQTNYDKSQESKTVSEMKEFVSKLGSFKATQASLKLHTSVAESLMESVKSTQFNGVLELQQDLLSNDLSSSRAAAKLKQLVYEGLNANMALRLLCLISICCNGLKEKILHELCELMLTTYGHKYLDIIRELISSGLILSTSSSLPFSSIVKTLELRNESDKLSEIYAGFIPLSVRAIQLAIQSPSDAQAKNLATIPGFFESIVTDQDAKASKLRKVLLRNSPKHHLPLIIVFYHGGLCWAEISALLELQSQLSDRYQLLITTTHVLNGNDLVAPA